MIAPRTLTFGMALPQLLHDSSTVDLYILADSHDNRTQRTLREWSGTVYGSEQRGPEVAVWGDVRPCAAPLQEVISIGADHLLLRPVSFEQREQLKAVAEVVGLGTTNGAPVSG